MGVEPSVEFGDKDWDPTFHCQYNGTKWGIKGLIPIPKANIHTSSPLKKN